MPRDERNWPQRRVPGGPKPKRQGALACNCHKDLPQDRAEAYKWALVAHSKGYKPVQPFMAEFELFLKPEEMKEGKARAEAYLANERKPK